MKGHTQTIWTHVRDRALPPPAPPGSAWRTRTRDPRLGSVTLRGIYAPFPGADCIALILHGLGGTVDSGYCRRAATEARALGLSSLRLYLRGADRSGEGIYHAGLIDDLVAAVASPEVAAYSRVVVLGFSLGGHVALRLAVAPPPRVAAVAAVCSPLDLEASCRIVDTLPKAVYRRYLLLGLQSMYARLAARCEVPLDLREARRIQRIRDWDEAIVAPWFGFADAAHYYETQSVGTRLGELEIPALYVYAADDPMVVADTIRPSLRSSGRLTVREDRGGHLGFRPDLSLGLPGRPGLAGQLLGWLARAS
jgi:uncharacterized protein